MFNPPLKNIDLLVADLDDTLVSRDSDRLYPHIAKWLHQHVKRGTLPCLAIATNRGGPPCRDAGWPWSHEFPTFEKDQARLDKLRSQLPKGTLILTACSYLTKSGRARIKKAQQNGEDLIAVYKQLTLDSQFLIPNLLSSHDPRCNPLRRKPHGQMISEAMAYFGVSDPRRVLMIGDSNDDAGAAKEVGCRFVWVKLGVIK